MVLVLAVELQSLIMCKWVELLFLTYIVVHCPHQLGNHIAIRISLKSSS